MVQAEQGIDMKNKVPYISQKNEETMTKYGPRACGITSLRMVLNFWGSNVSLSELNNLITKHKAFNENQAWVHAGLINIAREFGLIGYRIHYHMLDDENLPKAEQVFIQEGASEQDLKTFKESFNFAKQHGGLADLDRLVNSGVPIIASMEKSYANTSDTHMVVITGEEDGKFIVHDPWNFGPNFKMPKEEFAVHWTKRAIVVQAI